MHHAAKVNVVPRLFSISYEDGVSDLKFKLLSGTNIYKKISPVLGCLRVSDSKGRYINSDISKQSFAIEGSLTKSPSRTWCHFQRQRGECLQICTQKDCFASDLF